MIAPLKKGIETLIANPDKYKAFNPPNGYDSYENFVGFCRSGVDSCHKYLNVVIEEAHSLFTVSLCLLTMNIRLK